MALQLTPGNALSLTAEVSRILHTSNLFDGNGSFLNPLPLDSVAQAAAQIETLLKLNGVVIQGNVDKLIQAQPAILQLIGIK